MENTTSTLDIICALTRTEVLLVLLMQAQNQKPTMPVCGVQCPTSNLEPAATEGQTSTEQPQKNS